MLLGSHMDYNENAESRVVGLDRRDAILIVVDEVANKVGLHLVRSDEQEVDVTRYSEVIPTSIILEQKVGVGAGVVE